MVQRTKHLTRHERLKAENAKQAEEVARKNEVSSLNATIANKETEISNMRHQMEEQEKANDVSRKCIHALKEEVQQLEGKLLQKEKEKEELATSFSADFNSVIEKEREHFRVELSKQVGTIESKLNEKDNALESLSLELSEIREIRARLETENTALTAELDALKDSNNSSKMEVELDTLQKQIESLTTSSAGATGELFK
eukprot:sb/3470781/